MIDDKQLDSVSPFRQRVYRTLCRVPAGKVTTYARLAAALDCGSPRAVGQALRHNPFAPAVPCHRVIASDRSLGGFAGTSEGREIERKRKLLLSEGVRFAGDGRVETCCIIDPPSA